MLWRTARLLSGCDSFGGAGAASARSARAGGGSATPHLAGPPSFRHRAGADRTRTFQQVFLLGAALWATEGPPFFAPEPASSVAKQSHALAAPQQSPWPPRRSPQTHYGRCHWLGRPYRHHGPFIDHSREDARSSAPVGPGGDRACGWQPSLKIYSPRCFSSLTPLDAPRIDAYANSNHDWRAEDVRI